MIVNGRCCVPREVVAEVIEDWIATTEFPTGYECAGKVTAVVILSERSGVNERVIRGILDDTIPSRRGTKGKTVGFNIVDKLVCAMGCPEEWVFGRLAEHYGPIEASPEDWERMSHEEKAEHARALRAKATAQQRVYRQRHKEKREAKAA